MIEQIGEIRRFMAMRSSTVSGAVKVRKEREQRLFGKTREQAKRGKTKKEQKEIEKRFSEKISYAYSLFRKFLEYEGLPNSPYMRFEGSESVLNMIGKMVINGEDEYDIMDKAVSLMEDQYIKEQEEFEEQIGGDFWEFFDE